MRARGEQVTGEDAAAPEAEEQREGVEAGEGTAPGGLSLEDFVPELPVAAASAPAAATSAGAIPALRVARLAGLAWPKAMIAWRGGAAPIEAEVAPEVEREVLAIALEERASVLVEHAEGGAPLVVGVLQTRLPREVHVKAEVVHVEGEREVLLRAGRAAMRLREDGDIEIVGSRISAASRGLMRIVGRILRLN